MSENLWGELPVDEAITTPFSVLKEQATQISTLTKQVLIGDVSLNQRIKKNDKISYTLKISAPSLNYYSTDIVTVTYPPEIYPLTVYNEVEGGHFYNVEDLASLKDALKKVFTAEKTRKIIQGLAAQASEASSIF